MNFDQGQFDFDTPGSDAGWRLWRQQLEQQQRAFESRWGVILGKRVIVQLRDFAKPLKGIIYFVEKDSGHHQKEPLFRVGTVRFSTREIVSIVQDG